MRITHCDSQVLRVPLERPVDAVAKVGARLDHISVLLVHLDTDAGHRGIGFTTSIDGGAKALRATAEEDIGPLLVGEDPLDHERLGTRVYAQLHGIARGGLVAQAYSAFDLALWDLKGKAAGVPLHKLLGGARDRAQAYAADAGWLWMTADAIVEAARQYLDQALMGVKIRVGAASPEDDADRITRVREALGEDTWLGIDAGRRYDFGTALSMGHFFEEEMGVDWFEEPTDCEDIESHARLSQKIEVPLAVGASLVNLREFQAYIAAGAADILQPDVGRVGGLTRWLHIAALAAAHHRPLAACGVPQIGVHLACGITGVKAVEYVPWLNGLFAEAPIIVDGHLVPPKGPGLGLEIRGDVVQKYRIPS